MRKILGLAVVLLVGCGEVAPKVDPPTPIIPVGHISQSEPTDDGYLSFKVYFTAQLSRGRELKVETTSKPWLGNYVSFSDEVLQSPEKWVFFDCENIADRIIQTDLIQELAPPCKTLHDQALNYWKQNNYRPDEWVDDAGTHWTKVH